MSCYLRHLKDLFEEYGIKITPANRKLVDGAIHSIMGTGDTDCPATWKKLKQEIINDESKRREFMVSLNELLNT